MGLIRLTSDNIENLSITANPSRYFSSSSNGQVTGSVYVFAERSPAEKEAQKLSAFNDSTFNDSSLEELRQNILKESKAGSTDIHDNVNEYLGNHLVAKGHDEYSDIGVNNSAASLRKKKAVSVIRFEPSFKFTSDTLRKNVVKNVLFPYYRSSYPSLHWAVSNYHTLNFFTSSVVPSNSCLIYSAPSSSASGKTTYRPTDGFTFEFFINPRYTSDVAYGRVGHATTDSPSSEFHAGTVLHLSSCYAVSLVTGSEKDRAGLPSSYRIMLQLSHSADIPPTYVNTQQPHHRLDAYPIMTTGQRAEGRGIGDLIFLSSDNSLKKNHWHHIGIRWGGPTVNNGTGSFIIDGTVDSKFVIPSSSIMQTGFTNPYGEPDALFVGNYYNGRNNNIGSEEFIAGFFNESAVSNEGVPLAGAGLDVPDKFNFTNPLNAEIHELKIWKSMRSVQQLLTSSKNGHERPLPSDLMFYVPPFFTKESPKRNILQTPFQSISDTTDDPFNVSLSFGVGGHLLNLENFTREFVEGAYPRHYALTASSIDSTTDWYTANDFLYEQSAYSSYIRKRNLTILPCDNGLFLPAFRLLASGTEEIAPGVGTHLNKFTNDFGKLDFSLISLTDLVPTSSLYPGLVQINIDSTNVGNSTTGSIIEAIAGASPENPGVAPGSVLTIFQRTRDNTSNEIVFFDASNLFYGNKILKGSYVLKDNALTGSGGRVSLTLKDNENANLYRGDSITPHAKWASVGKLLYEEGIAAVLDPAIPMFGKDQFEVNLKGKQNIHIMELNIPCNAGAFNLSRNPAYSQLKPNDYASQQYNEFVYITGINFHDENLNVIGRTNLSQPIVKKEDDKLLFKVKVDF